MTDTARGVAVHERHADGPLLGAEPGARVVLVNAIAASREAGCAALAAGACHVRPAATVADALVLLEAEPADALIIDVNALSDDGLDHVRRLRARTRPARAPLIMLALDADREVTESFAAVADGFLARPIRAREVRLRLRIMPTLHRDRVEHIALRELRGEQARMWSVLLDFSRTVARMLDLEQVLDAIVVAAADMTSSRRISLMLPDDDQEHLVIVKAIGLDEAVRRKTRVRIGDAVAGRAFSSGERVTNVGPAQRSPEQGLYPGDTFVSQPIVTASLKGSLHRVGVLNITHRYGDQQFEEWELEFIDILGRIAGAAIDDTAWRSARDSLLKMERDLQVARRIQQSTFPRALPAVAGFDIGAWSEPAEETGGDTYDVIGYDRDPARGAVRLSTGRAERAFLLLADATGHGIGPALSVTQVRAMLRMAVRLQPELRRIVRDLNEQLCADLPRGRFVSAWFCELSAADGTITTFSAGQGPIFRYDAARDTVERREADGVPLGIVPDLEIAVSAPQRMRAGDVLLALSDGILDAVDVDGAPFGADRIAAVLEAHHGDRAAGILDALRDALAAFTAGRGCGDDCTAIVVRRGDG